MYTKKNRFDYHILNLADVDSVCFDVSDYLFEFSRCFYIVGGLLRIYIL